MVYCFNTIQYGYNMNNVFACCYLLYSIVQCCYTVVQYKTLLAKIHKGVRLQMKMAKTQLLNPNQHLP